MRASMRGIKVGLVLVPALLGSTALAMAQDGGIAGTAGVVILSLPNIQTGVVSDTATAAPSSANGVALGLLVGVDGRMQISPVGEHSAFVGFSAYGVVARGTTSNATTLSGSGALIVPGYTTPSGASMTLTTASVAGDADALSDLAHGGETNIVNAPNQAGATFGWGVNPGDGVNIPSFQYGGVFLDGSAVNPRSAAFGAIADSDGNILVAVGDLTGVVVTTDVTQNVALFGGDITFGLSGDAGSNVAVSGFVGPSYKFLGRDITSSVTVDFPELGGVAVDPVGGLEFPMYRLTRDEQIDSHYLGGVAGGSLSTPVSDTMVLNLGAKVGLYAMSTSVTGSEVASVFGGNPAPVTNPTEVTNLNTLSLTDNGVAFSLQGNGSVTMPLSESTQITLGGGAEYLSRVATLDHAAAATVDTSAFGPGDDDGTATYAAQEDLRPIISYGSMLNFNAFVTFSGQF
jgi:hypothetical protein